MKLLLIPVTFILAMTGIFSCRSSSTPKAFCDSGCISDTLKFYGDHPLQPYVFLLPDNCGVDSLLWSYKGAGTNRKTDIGYSDLKLNPQFVRCYFKDTAHAYLLFNDCISGRGYQVMLPFSKTGMMSKRSSGINSLDPKFSVADGMIAYTDRGNIYVEEVSSGKKAMMTFGEATDMDYDVIHETLDSVNISRDRIYVKIKLQGKWEELDKKITLAE